jgi:hypothetical protein
VTVREAARAQRRREVARVGAVILRAESDWNKCALIVEVSRTEAAAL